MRISVIGAGYVGLPTAVGFALRGNQVIVAERKQEKVDMINNGMPPIYEKGLEGSLRKALEVGTFRSTANLEDAIMNSDITFVAVGTPSREDGSIALSQINKISEDIGTLLAKKDAYHVVVIKSTVVPGTTNEVVLPTLERFSGKKAGVDFGLGMNPEFLREGTAMEDFLDADRIVIGAIDVKSASEIEKCYSEFKAPIIKTNIKTAEMIKYASNSLLATLISFSNEIADISEHIKGIDGRALFKAVHLDRRITQNSRTAGIAHYINSGCGYGGSCFPKDVNAIINHAESLGYVPRLLKDVKNINDERIDRIIHRAEKFGDLKNKNACILGMAFKKDTDDTRESQGVRLLKKLLEREVFVKIYDPMALKNVPDDANMQKMYSAQDALHNSDICFVMTDWDEFSELKERDFKNLMKTPVVFDAKKILERMRNIDYLEIGEEPE